MTERERLNELLKSCGYIDEQFSERLVDFLLENGVIFPRAKVNQSIWTADPFTDGIPREGYITSINIGYDRNAYYCSFGERSDILNKTKHKKLYINFNPFIFRFGNIIICLTIDHDLSARIANDNWYLGV